MVWSGSFCWSDSGGGRGQDASSLGFSMNGINFDQLEGIFWLFENIKYDMIKRTILAPSVLYDKHVLSKAYVDLEMGHEDGGVLDDGSHGDQITPNMLFK